MKLYRLFISVTEEKSEIKLFEYEAVEKKMTYECRFIDPNYGVEKSPNSLKRVMKENIGVITNKSANWDVIICYSVWLPSLELKGEFEEKLKSRVSNILEQRKTTLDNMTNSLRQIL